MDQISGLSKRMPIWAFFMVFFVLSSVGLPGLNGFVSEFYCLIGAFTASRDNATWPGMLGPWYAAFAAAGMIFAAMYLLMMTGKIVWGPLKEPAGHGHHHGGGHIEGNAGGGGRALPPDLTLREISVLAPLALVCLWLGFQSPVVTDTMQKPIDTMLAAYPALIEQPRIVQQPTPSQPSTISPQSSLSGALVDG